MPGVAESPAAPVAAPLALEPSFQVAHQRVWLDINPFSISRKITGKTEITITPLSSDLRTIKLHCRQAKITRCAISGTRGAPTVIYSDPYRHASLVGRSTANQWHLLQSRLEGEIGPTPEPELILNLPKTIRLQERALDTPVEGVGRRFSTEALGAVSGLAAGQIPFFNPITINIEFSIEGVRDGLQYVGCDEGDLRYPHVFSQGNLRSPASSIFPCLDDATSRCSWDLAVRCPKTIGDALMTCGRTDIEVFQYSEEDKARDFVVVASGDMTDEIVDVNDKAFKTTSFHLDNLILPRHIGFAIGPFEVVNLSAMREHSEDEKLGKSAIPLHGFCLPGRAEEVKNTCFPLARAIDYFLLSFGAYPFSSYKILFVDDMVDSITDTAALTIASNRLLFPEEIIEPLDRITFVLVNAAASQWCGVNMIPQDASDIWLISGLASYMTDTFLRKLCGYNDQRYRQTDAVNRITKMDVKRPSLYDTGPLLHLDPSQMEFVSLKAMVVLFILNQRLIKATGNTGLVRIITKILLSNKTGDLANGALSTAHFARMCEKVGHTKLDSFFNQWVYGAGCPHFQVTQRFNKKRLVVEMQISQVQKELESDRLDVDNFMRDTRENLEELDLDTVQPVFTGPMTIRIHEADGTPYEHVVEIKEKVTRFEIPYNTKYKRLKRTRRQKERLAAGGANVANAPAADGEEGNLLYCLGDILQAPDEMEEWQCASWSDEDENKMNSESFEWIRVDCDFEWICKLQINMPPHMFLSQLQQDRDIAAQFNAVLYFANSKADRLISTFLVRTLMDQRYYYRIRVAAALALKNHAKDEVSWIGLFHLRKAFEDLFCLPSGMIRPNDFEDRALHSIQCAIVRAVGEIRDNSQRAPLPVRKFLYGTLRFNDNGRNKKSDTHFKRWLVRSLSEAVASAPPLEADVLAGKQEEDDIVFFRNCLDEIDRHRRRDEWLPSYQNLLSIEGMEAKARLMRQRLLQRDAREFLQYTQITSHDDLRIAAFNCLIDLGFGLDNGIMRYFLFNLGHDPSPYVRQNLLRLFGRWLGMIATGEHFAEKRVEDIQGDGLIIEAEANTTALTTEDLRNKDIASASDALRNELSSNEDLNRNLWEATNSKMLTISEIGMLLEYCRLLYKPEDKLIVELKLPRYWKVESGGRKVLNSGTLSHIMRFKRTNKVRTKAMVKWQPSVIEVRPEPKPTLKRKSSAFEPMSAPRSKMPKKSPTPLGNAGSPPPEKKKLTLKLNIGSSAAGSFNNAANGSQTPIAQTPGGTQKKLKLTMKPPTPSTGH